MTRKQVIIASIVADILDIFVIGQIPGVSWFIDIPVIVMHVAYAGPSGYSTLLELIPGIGTLPIFTIAGFMHEEKNE